MATGADEKFWQNARLRGALKHCIVRRYLPVFLSRTSAHYSKSAVYFDGYAVRGQYKDGRLGSAGLMMEFAINQKYSQERDYTLLLYERDKESFESLEQLAEWYRQRGLDVRAERKDVAAVLDEVMAASANKPMFVFLDPCGVGVCRRVFNGCCRNRNEVVVQHAQGNVELVTLTSAGPAVASIYRKGFGSGVLTPC